MKIMSNLLYEINDAITGLTESLADGEIDEQTYLDTIESMGADTAVENIVKSILNADAEAEAIKTEKMMLDGKQKHAELKVDKLKAILVKYMELTHQSKLKAGIFNVSKGSSQSVELLYDDIENYPEEYLVQQRPKIDKRKLLADLKDGVLVDGALIKQTEYVKIK